MHLSMTYTYNKKIQPVQNVGQNPEAHTEDKNSNHEPYADIHAWLKVYLKTTSHHLPASFTPFPFVHFEDHDLRIDFR